MAHTLEDMVAVLEATTSPFALADDLQIFQEGLADAARRIRALEAQTPVKAKAKAQKAGG
jgi:hypothetical protein